MPFRSVPLPIGLAICDTSWKISRSEALALWAAGERAILRYVFFGAPRQQDLDLAELTMLTTINADHAGPGEPEGFIVIVVQHVRSPEQGLSGWIGSAERGTADVGWAIANSITAGYVAPPGDHPLSLGCDLEDIVRGGPDQAHAWASGCTTYGPLMYIGFASGQSSGTLDALPNDPQFWADFAPLPMRPTPSKGWALHQQLQTAVAGIGVDRDTVLIGGVIWGLASVRDLNLGPPDPREAPTTPLLIHVADTEPPPPALLQSPENG